MAILLNPDCRDEKHASCSTSGWDEETDQADYCPCHCHLAPPRCGAAHEAPGLAYLGACVMGARHAGLCQFIGPLEGTIVSVAIGETDAWDRTRTRDAAWPAP